MTEENPESHLPHAYPASRHGLVLFWIGVAFATFQIVTSFGIPLDLAVVPGLTAINVAGVVLLGWLGWLFLVRGAAKDPWLAVPVVALAVVWAILALYPGGVPSVVTRAIHVGFLCLLGGGLLASVSGLPKSRQALLWGLGVAGFLVGLYHWGFHEELMIKAGEIEPHDVVIGTVAIVGLLFLAWFAMGPALTVVGMIFLLYSLFGHYLPAPLDHRSFDFEQVIEHMAFSTEGIYGTPTLVSATYIFLFVLFGAFMEKAGVVAFFNDVSMAIFGRSKGGPAKVAIATSALLGTVSGSGVANVVASGQFTIPLMRRYGFKNAFAGGVEATASMGGQIMPPVMGAVAFIMAETINVPYSDIVQAAIVPALLYFVTCFWSVHLEAGKLNLHGMAATILPSARKVIRERWFLVLPLIVLVVLLFGGYTPLFAGSVGLMLTSIMIIGAAFALGLSTAVLRLVFWMGLAGISAASLWYSVSAVGLVVLALVVAGLFSGKVRPALVGCVDALAEGARQAIPVGLACAVVGLVIGTMTLTGLGTVIGEALIAIGKDNLLLTLVLTMVFSLILGMGIPTIPNYIITSSLAAPILLEIGVPLIVSHMYVFYFGIMADLTPPVALAAFAAAPMAKETGMRIAVQALRIALPGFILPYMAVYNPQLMLQPVPGLEGAAYWASAAFVIVKALAAVLLWGIGAFGWLAGRVSVTERAVAIAAALLLVTPMLVTDLLGFALGGAVVAWHIMRISKGKQMLAAGT
ncbi:TRAP transporter permease [Mongoliimonas terrestris]|uniref:TRAP transporter permease n=1 Tax=Mongoliimonas terrestris TaxID=1709001 RepID=UPI001FD8D8D9|nr:TRAP transporter fused permease subunit [Mongoliimonas terrestris]